MRTTSPDDALVAGRPESSPFRLAILASHAVQYQAPLFRALAEAPDIDLTVFYCWNAGASDYFDPGFGRVVKWDTPLMTGYRAVTLPNASWKPGSDHFWGLINPRVVVELRRGQFDAVLVHGWAHCSDWLAMLTAFGLRIPVFQRAEANVGNAAHARLRSRVAHVLLNRVWRQLAGIFATGTSGREYFARRGVPLDRIFVLPYAVDNRFFFDRAKALASARARIREDLGIVDGTPIILFAGKLIERKRPQDLLAAFARIHHHHGAVLLFVGDGELRPSLETAAESLRLDNVRFAGFQNQERITRFYAAADVFALPSTYETWGLVINEAMCFSLPIVASRGAGAVRDLVQDGCNGYVFEPGDIDALARALDRLLSDPAQRRGMGQRSAELIAEWSHDTDVAVLRAAFAATGPKRR
jgi:glycosyltransferase involved in cell wall biosynthesis